MKKSSFLVLIVISVLLLTACDSSNKVEVENEMINTSKMEHQKCSRAGQIDGGEVDLQYDIYFTGEVLNLIKSQEKVISADSTILDTYEESYNNIQANYKGIKYYDTEVVRDNNSVSSLMTINYDKVDIDKIIDIEGEDNNIFENGQAKVEKWKDLAGKFGMECSDVTEES